MLRLDELAADGTDRSLAARLAAGFGLPDLAVAIARRAGRDGVMLTEAGWPLAVDPPAGPVEPALALGLIRQESNFNTEALSPVGARGLMQLMPATAQAVAHRLGDGSVNLAALSTDPAYNMRLGTAYLGGLLDQFGGAMPYAVAGYNAGPGRVADWLAANGDPAAGGIDMVDWIELIPFSETRNYVQRVVENVVVYRASPAPCCRTRWRAGTDDAGAAGGQRRRHRLPAARARHLGIRRGAGGGGGAAGGGRAGAAGGGDAARRGGRAVGDPARRRRGGPGLGGDRRGGRHVAGDAAAAAAGPARPRGGVRAVPPVRHHQARPDRRIDRMPGRVGVMGDDLAAGLAAAVLVALLGLLRHRLGG